MAIVLVARLRGPDHCVVNVLGMVLPELLILYLFFFYFFLVIGGPVLKIEAVAHRAYPCITNPDFFWAPP